MHVKNVKSFPSTDLFLQPSDRHQLTGLLHHVACLFASQLSPLPNYTHHLIFCYLKTAVKHNCVQSSFTYRYNKMLWPQIVNNSNDIGSYKMLVYTVVMLLTFILIIISIPSTPHSFIPDLKPSFSVSLSSFFYILPTVAFLSSSGLTTWISLTVDL